MSDAVISRLSCMLTGRLDEDWPVIEDTSYPGRRGITVGNRIKHNSNTCDGRAHLGGDIRRLDDPAH